MPDDAEPPRKFYGFKPKPFVRENEVREPSPAEVHPAEPRNPTPPPDRIDVRELNQQASTPGPVLRPNGPRVEQNQIHDILKDNLAQENAAGLNRLEPLAERRSRRRRDYFLVVISTVLGFGTLAAYGLRTGNVMLFVSSIAAIGLIVSAVTWVMWFIMDKY